MTEQELIQSLSDAYGEVMNEAKREKPHEWRGRAKGHMYDDLDHKDPYDAVEERRQKKKRRKENKRVSIEEMIQFLESDRKTHEWRGHKNKGKKGRPTIYSNYPKEENKRLNRKLRHTPPGEEQRGHGQDVKPKGKKGGEFK